MIANKWKEKRYGPGWEYKLANGLVMSVNVPLTRGGEKYTFTVFGVRSKPEYDTPEAAALAAEEYAKKILASALKNLGGDQ